MAGGGETRPYMFVDEEDGNPRHERLRIRQI